MEGRAFVAKSLFSSRKCTEVLSGLWNSLPVQTDYNTAQLLISMSDVKENLINGIKICFGALAIATYFVGNFWSLRSLGSVCKEEESRRQHEQQGNDDPL